jgi:DNA-3-methyladenine glycosylase II
MSGRAVTGDAGPDLAAPAAGDLGIRQAVQRAWALPQLPTIDEVREFGAPWSAQRTFAAALLWRSLRPVPAPA